MQQIPKWWTPKGAMIKSFYGKSSFSCLLLADYYRLLGFNMREFIYIGFKHTGTIFIQQS